MRVPPPCWAQLCSMILLHLPDFLPPPSPASFSPSYVLDSFQKKSEAVMYDHDDLEEGHCTSLQGGRLPAPEGPSPSVTLCPASSPCHACPLLFPTVVFFTFSSMFMVSVATSTVTTLRDLSLTLTYLLGPRPMSYFPSGHLPWISHRHVTLHISEASHCLLPSLHFFPVAFMSKWWFFSRPHPPLSEPPSDPTLRPPDCLLAHCPVHCHSEFRCLSFLIWTLAVNFVPAL